MRCHDEAMADLPRFLTLPDVAEILNTSVAQVYAMVRRGDLPAIKIGGRGQWRVSEADLEDVHRAACEPTPRSSSTSTRSTRPKRTSRTLSADRTAAVATTLLFLRHQVPEK